MNIKKYYELKKLMKGRVDYSENGSADEGGEYVSLGIIKEFDIKILKLIKDIYK